MRIKIKSLNQREMQSPLKTLNPKETLTQNPKKNSPNPKAEPLKAKAVKAPKPQSRTQKQNPNPKAEP